MRKFPAMCVDDFYADPDKVRKWALTQKFEGSQTGGWPGKRTKYLSDLNPKLFNTFVNKVSYLFYDFSSKPEMTEVQTYFQVTEAYDPDPKSVKNDGWIHQDNGDGCDYDVAGIIYMTPDVGIESGTSIYRLNGKKFVNHSVARLPFYGQGIDDGYDAALKANNSQFEEVIRFGNVYNRFVAYDANLWHGSGTMHTKNPRLLQIFFAKLKCDTMGSPIERSKFVEKKLGI